MALPSGWEYSFNLSDHSILEMNHGGPLPEVGITNVIVPFHQGFPFYNSPLSEITLYFDFIFGHLSGWANTAQNLGFAHSLRKVYEFIKRYEPRRGPYGRNLWFLWFSDGRYWNLF